MNADGSEQRQLTWLGNNSEPTWSADNRFIFFVSDRDGRKSIYRMNPDGSGQTLVVSGGDNRGYRQADNGRTAFISNRRGIWELFMDGQPVTRADWFAWQPDGARVVIELGKMALFTVNGPGHPVQKVVEGAETRNASWAPDGSRIVFASNREGNSKIFTVRPDGGGLQALTPADRWCQVPAWSFDGRWIAFVMGEGPGWGLYRMAPDGSNWLRLADNPHPGRGLAWSPDSRQLAFVSRDLDIYVVNASGSGLRQLTTDPAADYEPAWSR